MKSALTRVAAVGALLACMVVCDVEAQEIVVPSDSLILTLPSPELNLVGGRALRGATRFIIPTTMLHLAVDDGSARPERNSRFLLLQYRVTGLTKAYTSALATRVQEDLRARLVASGASVLLYEHIETTAAVSGLKRLAVDRHYRAPVTKGTTPTVTYAVVAPSEAQLFAGAAFAKHSAFRDLAREMNAVVLIPELFVVAPNQRPSEIFPSEVRPVAPSLPGMDLMQAGLTFITPAGATGSIKLAEPLRNLEWGTIDAPPGLDPSIHVTTLPPLPLASQIDSTRIGLPIGMAPDGSHATSYSHELIVHEPIYELGVMRGAAAFFRAAMEIVLRERR